MSDVGRDVQDVQKEVQRKVARHVQVRSSPTRQKTVAIVSKPGRPELRQVLPALEKWLEQRNYAVVMDKESAAYFSGPL